MVHCVTCKRTFKSRIGKTKDTRCESCAKLWRELQLREDDEGRKERNRELDIMEKELEIKKKQLEMERQKVTIKEMFPAGGTIELTCYYDDSMQEKVRSLMKGAYLALPSSTTSTTTMQNDREQLVDKMPREYSSPFGQHDIKSGADATGYKRVHFEPEINRSSSSRNSSTFEIKELPEYRKHRKLPSVEAIRNRMTSRQRLEDEGSSFGSGGSAD